MRFFALMRSLMLPRCCRLFSLSTPKVFIAAESSSNAKVVAEMDNEKLELKAFTEFLQDTCGFKFDVNSFNHRIRLQKYVFISKFLGWNNKYDYNIYVRGPYSPDLAKDYYNLKDVSISPEESKGFLSGLDKDKFSQIIQGKRIEWLEVGTTMLSLYDSNKDKVKRESIADLLLERTKDIKSEYDNDGFIEEVLRELMENKLIKSG